MKKLLSILCALCAICGESLAQTDDQFWFLLSARNAVAASAGDTNSYNILYLGETNALLLVDSSGSSLHGTNSGCFSVIAWTNNAGVVRRSIKAVDGNDDRISIPATTLFSGCTNAFCGAWIKITQYPASSGFVLYFDTGWAGFTRFGIYITDAGALTAVARDDQTGASHTATNGIVPTNAWAFICANFDATNDKLTAWLNATSGPPNTATLNPMVTNACLSSPTMFVAQIPSFSSPLKCEARYVLLKAHGFLSAAAITNLYNISAPWSDQLP